jgi:hypothetical protein
MRRDLQPIELPLEEIRFDSGAIRQRYVSIIK